MIPQSAAYRQRVEEDDREWHAKAKITLANGTALNVTDSDIMSGGVAIDAGVSTSGNFQIGTANIDELKLTLQNWDGKFSSYDFDQAIIEPSIGLVLPDGTTEWVPKGSYTIDDPSVTGNIITLTAFNRMVAFDKNFASCNCTFPATLQALLSACCTDCGVPQKTLTFTNGAYVVTSKPENCTYRDVIACIAQLAGCFARITYDGKLELAWYDYERFISEDNLDGGTLMDYTSGDAADGGSLSDYDSGDRRDGGIFRAGLQPVIKPKGVSARTIGTDDLTVTGIKIVPQNDAIQPVVCGISDYMLVIQNNPLIQSDPSGLAAAIGEKLIGFTYRPAEITAMGDPSVEPGDVMLVTDKDGNEYQTIISRISYKIGTSEGYYADGETKTKKQTQVSTEGAKAVAAAKQYTKKIESLSTLMSELLANALGTYQTIEVLADGSQIIYQHDQPTLAASHTIWKKAANVFAVSTDGGETWNAGVSSDGNLVVKLLEALRIQSPVDEDVYIDLINGDISAKTLRNSATDSYMQIGTDGIGGKGNQSEGMYLYRDGQMKAMWASQPDSDALAGFKEWLLTKGDLWIQAADNASGQPIRIYCTRSSNGDGMIKFAIDNLIPFWMNKDKVNISTLQASSASITNAAVNKIAVNNVIQSENDVIQIAFDESQKRVYFKFKISDGQWASWNYVDQTGFHTA